MPGQTVARGTVRGADSAYLCNALALQSILKLEIA